jgi:hypothetical protein
MPAHLCPHCFDPRVSFRHPDMLKAHVASTHPEQFARHIQTELPMVPADAVRLELLKRTTDNADDAPHVEQGAVDAFIELAAARVVRTAMAQRHDIEAVRRLVQQRFDVALRDKLSGFLRTLER